MTSASSNIPAAYCAKWISIPTQSATFSTPYIDSFAYFRFLLPFVNALVEFERVRRFEILSYDSTWQPHAGVHSRTLRVDEVTGVITQDNKRRKLVAVWRQTSQPRPAQASQLASLCLQCSVDCSILAPALSRRPELLSLRRRVLP